MGLMLDEDDTPTKVENQSSYNPRRMLFALTPELNHPLPGEAATAAVLQCPRMLASTSQPANAHFALIRRTASLIPALSQRIQAQSRLLGRSPHHQDGATNEYEYTDA